MKKEQEIWILTLAESLVTEITRQMSGIQMSNVGVSHWETSGGELAIVWGLLKGEGDFNLYVQFGAEWKLFYRLAYKMMNCEPDSEDVREYAMEYFNIICGRFVSELVNQKHVAARFYPVKYELSSKGAMLQREASLNTLAFLSDAQEQAAFSWSVIPAEQFTMFMRAVQSRRS